MHHALHTRPKIERRETVQAKQRTQRSLPHDVLRLDRELSGREHDTHFELMRQLYRPTED